MKSIFHNPASKTSLGGVSRIQHPPLMLRWFVMSQKRFLVQNSVETSGGSQMSSSVPFGSRVNLRTAGSIQISSPARRAGKMICYCFKRDTVSFGECKSSALLMQLDAMLVINGKGPVMLWRFHNMHHITVSWEERFNLLHGHTWKPDGQQKCPSPQKVVFLAKHFHQ